MGSAAFNDAMASVDSTIAHLNGNALAQAVLGPCPTDDASLAAGVDAFLGSRLWPRKALVDILDGDREGSGEAHATHLHDLLDPRCAIVTTGQQPAVGGGPLYTLVKTAHAIALVRRLRRLGRLAVPVFWCASEDHDLGEAAHADLIGQSGAIQRVHADLGTGRASLRHRPAIRWWTPLWDALEGQTGPCLGRNFLAGMIPGPHEGMGAWLCRLLRSVFADDGLICVEGHRLRPLWQQELQRSLVAWPVQALEDLRVRLLDAGWGDPLGPLPTAPWFHDRPEGRTALDPEVGGGGATGEALDLSPGAALRPVLQQAALPSAVAVLGPGELAYHARLGPVYTALGVPRPLILPRMRCTLIGSSLARSLASWGVLQRTIDDDGPLERPASAPTEGDPGDPALERVLTSLTSVITDLESSARDAASQGREDRRRRLTAVQVRVSRQRERLLDSLRRGRDRAAGRLPFGTLVAQIRPRGLGQDRVMSLFQALWRHGPGLGQVLVERSLDTIAGHHASVLLA